VAVARTSSRDDPGQITITKSFTHRQQQEHIFHKNIRINALASH
jgi:hypothetical protein